MLEACHWKLNTEVVVPSGSAIVPRLAVSGTPWRNDAPVITGAPVGASLTAVSATTSVAFDSTVSSTPLASL
ncbi:hypothetical protein D9M72_306670 [compost metagenome]